MEKPHLKPKRKLSETTHLETTFSVFSSLILLKGAIRI